MQMSLKLSSEPNISQLPEETIRCPTGGSNNGEPQVAMACQKEKVDGRVRVAEIGVRII